MLSHLLKGLHLSIGDPTSLAYLVGGSIFGMLSGVLPGLGGPVILSITLALIFKIPLTGVLCIFLAIHAASFFTSSITAILLNTPQHAESFAVSFDGFPMAQRGEGGRALGISAASTCIGGLVGCIILVGFIQIIDYLPDIFHPPEYVALITIAIVLVATLGTDAVPKAIMSAGIGIVIATIGQDPNTGAFRFTFGSVNLTSGVNLVALALGAFAIPQMILLFGVSSRIAKQDMTGREVDSTQVAEIPDKLWGQVLLGIKDTVHHWKMTVLSGVIGILTGIIPGIGGFAANFISYGTAQRLSKRKHLFGSGIPEGIIAPEGSSLAKEAGGMIPLLGLGIPGGVAGALFLAALSLKGVQVGVGFSKNYPDLAYEIVWIIALGGIVGTGFGLLIAPYLAKVTKVPGPCLVPIIMVTTIIGAYSAGPSFFDVMEVLIFACIGFLLRRLRYAIAVLVIAVVLGNSYEQNMFLTYQLYPGATIFTRPVADVIFLLAFIMIGQQIRHQRKVTRKNRDELKAMAIVERASATEKLERTANPYPLLSLLVTSGILCGSVAAVMYAQLSYDFLSALTPTIGGILAVLGAVCRLPVDVRAYARYRHQKSLEHVEVTTVAMQAPEKVLALAAVTTRERVAVGAEVGARSTVLIPGGEGTNGASALNGGTHNGSLHHGNGDAPHITVIPTPNLAHDIAAGITVEDGLGDIPGTVVVHDPEYTGWVAERFAPIAEKRWGLHGQYTREVVAFVWFGGAILGTYLFGFYPALITFGLLYGLFGTRRTFKTVWARVAFGVACAALAWVQTWAIFTALHVGFTPHISL